MFCCCSRSEDEDSRRDAARNGGRRGSKPTIRAHSAVPAKPPSSLRRWGMAQARSERETLFRASTVRRATTMGSTPTAADKTFTPDDDTITFVNVRAIDLDHDSKEVLWVPVHDAEILVANLSVGELPSTVRPKDAFATRNVWWVHRGRYMIRSDDAQIAETLLGKSRTLADIAKLPFETKQMWLRNELDQRTDPRAVPLTVKRDKICDSMKTILREILSTGQPVHELMAMRFVYAIEGETEHFQDAGGISREVYAKTFSELFSEERGLFKLSEDGDTYVVRANTEPEKLMDFYLTGLLMGKMLLDGLLIPCHLSVVLRKRLLEAPIKFQDLQGTDHELYTSLQWARSNPIEDVIYETFSVQEAEGQPPVELKPDGANVEVTDENKIEWITLRVRHALIESIQQQTDAIREGLHSVIPPKLLSVFAASELELLLSGTGEIDVRDWMVHAVYKNCDEMTPQIRWFWAVVEGMTGVDRCKLLSFATGCANLPVEGFAGLTSTRGVSRNFQISVVEGQDRLPQAHTCFNILELSEYKNQAMLEQMLRLAMAEGAEGFFVDE